MKKFRVLFLVTLVIALLSNICLAATWQKSNSLSLRLGVRDKYTESTNEYIANFVIYAPKNKTYYHSVKGFGDKNTYSTFPTDYNELHPPVGDYSWQCYVDGEVVISGQFRVTINASKSSIEAFY